MSDHRLSRDILPRHYALELRPNLDEHTFTGTVAIDVEVGRATDRITCNAAELVVLDAAVIVDGERMALSASLDEAAERLDSADGLVHERPRSLCMDTDRK